MEVWKKVHFAGVLSLVGYGRVSSERGAVRPPCEKTGLSPPLVDSGVRVRPQSCRLVRFGKCDPEKSGVIGTAIKPIRGGCPIH